MSHLSLSLRAATAELSGLRSSLRDFLEKCNEPADDWLIIATELVTNAIEASPRDEPVEVRIEANQRFIDLYVVDMGPGFDLRLKASVSPAVERGRGLMMVNALTDQLTVAVDNGRTVATASRRRSSAPKPKIGRIQADEQISVDVVVIGLGSAGEALARQLAAEGLSVVGFERDRVGGECPFIACMPSKSLLADAHEARGGEDPASCWDAAIERRRKVVDNLDDSKHLEGLTNAGVEVIRADARLVGERRVVANNSSWDANHVVLATGSAPIIPDIDGLDRERVWTPFDALTEDARPARIGIIGAGPVGCELADIYSSFGASVILFDHADRLLPDHDRSVATEYEAGIRALGIDLTLSAEIEQIQHGSDEHVITYTGPAGSASTTVDQIIVAVGQAPRLTDIGLESVGIDPSAPPRLDDQRRIPDQPWLSMIGDLNGQSPWTHGANRDAAIVGAAILGTPWQRTSAAMPRATFTTPTAAHVGLAATEENGFIRGIGKHSEVARGSTDELDDGLVVVAVDPETGNVAGCSAVGPLADELIATATCLVHFEIPIDRARTQVFAFPTISQVLEVAIADAAEQWSKHVSG